MTYTRGSGLVRGMDETRSRFLRAVAERIPPERVQELHLFQPIRQGGVESGIAVIAAVPEPAVEAVPGSAAREEDRRDEDEVRQRLIPERLTIFRASYRLTLKGGERGRWEVDVAAEADAPLATVDDLVRGVQQRAGEDALPERLTANDLRAALAGETWTARR